MDRSSGRRESEVPAGVELATEQRLLEEQSALRHVATLVAQGGQPEEVFTSVAGEIGRLFEGQAALLRYGPDATITVVGSWDDETFRLGAVAPLGGHNVSTLVFETHRSARIDRYLTDDSSAITALAVRSGARTSVGVPIIVESRLWGVAIVGRPGEASIPAGTEERLADFTELVATAIANADARAELAASRARVVTAGDEARRRIERNLHDGVQQRLVSLGLRLRTLESVTRPEEAEVRAEIHRAVGEVNGVVDELREISHGLYPAVLSRGGLAAAVRTLARQSPIPVEVDVRTATRPTEPVEAAGYYIVAEAVANAVKHASASELVVTLEVEDGLLRVTVRDDGVGGADPDRGSGLTGLRDRVEALGGQLEITSAPGEGTVLVAEIPSR
jgi:signal transduction histidine kinase